MKNVKNPNRAQKFLMTKRKLDWTEWWVKEEKDGKLILINKETKKEKSIDL